MTKKLIKVAVFFKYSEDGEKPNSIRVISPCITYEGDDLKGRKRNSDDAWYELAIKEYNQEKGKSVQGKDFFVRRFFKKQ
jgi:hypothetical protein